MEEFLARRRFKNDQEGNDTSMKTHFVQDNDTSSSVRNQPNDVDSSTFSTQSTSVKCTGNLLVDVDVSSACTSRMSETVTGTNTDGIGSTGNAECDFSNHFVEETAAKTSSGDEASDTSLPSISSVLSDDNKGDMQAAPQQRANVKHFGAQTTDSIL
jgi:hypothetical protein